ncbi:MAG: hypothetical protein AB7K09_23690 [Planctomycetota bacterium]
MTSAAPLLVATLALIATVAAWLARRPVHRSRWLGVPALISAVAAGCYLVMPCTIGARCGPSIVVWALVWAGFAMPAVQAVQALSQLPHPKAHEKERAAKRPDLVLPLGCWFLMFPVCAIGVPLSAGLHGFDDRVRSEGLSNLSSLCAPLKVEIAENSGRLPEWMVDGEMTLDEVAPHITVTAADYDGSRLQHTDYTLHVDRAAGTWFWRVVRPAHPGSARCSPDAYEQGSDGHVREVFANGTPW